MTFEDVVKHPHYKARGSIVEWEGVKGGAYEGKTLRGTATPLRFKGYENVIWRGCPTIGMDNEDILEDAGFSPTDIAEMYEKKIIRKQKPKK